MKLTPTLEWFNRRERQLLVHSCLYYRMDTNLISDTTFDEWSKEMAEAIIKEPELFSNTDYYEEFKGFDGSTGHDLPYWRDEIVHIASNLIRVEGTIK